MCVLLVYKRMSGWRNSKMLLLVMVGGRTLLAIFCPPDALHMLCWGLENDQYGLYPWACSPALWFLVGFSQGGTLGNWGEGGGWCWGISSPDPLREELPCDGAGSLNWRSQLFCRGLLHMTLSWVVVTPFLCPLKPLVLTASLFLTPSLSLIMSLYPEDGSDHCPRSLLSTLGSRCSFKEMLVDVSYLLVKWICTYILFFS